MKDNKNSYEKIDKLLEDLIIYAKEEAIKLSSYNKRKISIVDLNPLIPHCNIYGVLFGNDSGNRAMRAIADCSIIGVSYHVSYPKQDVTYKFIKNPSIRTTRTQVFLTPLEVCFINSVKSNELLNIINNNIENKQEYDISLF